MNDTNSHDDACLAFEIDLERQARNALPPERAAALEAHLATCESCREYRADAGRLDAVLEAAPDTPGAPDWDRLHRRISWTARQPHILFGVSVVVFAGAVAFPFVAGAGWGTTLLFAFTGWVIAEIPERIGALRERKRVLAQLAGPGDLLGFYKEELERSRVAALAAGFTWLIAGFFFLAFAGVLWILGKDTTASLVTTGACVALAFFWWFVRYPWLRRRTQECAA